MTCNRRARAEDARRGASGRPLPQISLSLSLSLTLCCVLHVHASENALSCFATRILCPATRVPRPLSRVGARFPFRVRVSVACVGGMQGLVLPDPCLLGLRTLAAMFAVRESEVPAQGRCGRNLGGHLLAGL